MTLPTIRAYVAALTPNAPLFDGLRHEDTLDTHAEACAPAKLPRTTLHDHRHHYARQRDQREMPVHLVAAQLGIRTPGWCSGSMRNSPRRPMFFGDFSR